MRKVIGIGLPKTGTSSLATALGILGYQRLAGFSMAKCYRYLHGDFEGLVDSLAAYDGAEDWPWPLLYQPLYRTYPQALFVLTTRDSESVWLDSMVAHAAKKRALDRRPGMRQHVFGYESPADDPEHHIQFYRDHNANVRDFFYTRGHMIEITFGQDDGWEKLCAHLGLPRPSTPFPHVNRR